MWLVDHTYPVRQYQQHSSVYVTANGKGGFRKRTLANVLDLADFHDYAVSRTRFLNCDRTIVWGKGRHFLIMDRVTAAESGEHFARCSLRALGEHELRGGDLFLEQDGRYCKILTDGAGNADVETYRFTNTHWDSFYPHAEPVVKIFQRDRKLTLAKGDTFGFTSLLVPYASNEQEQAVSLQSLSETCALIRDGESWMLAGLDRIPGMDETAAVFVVDEGSIAVTGAQSVCGGLLKSDTACDLRIDTVRQQVTFDAVSDTEVTFVGIAKAVFEDDQPLRLRRSAHENHLSLTPGTHVLTVREWVGFDRASAYIERVKAAAEMLLAAKASKADGAGGQRVPDLQGVEVETVLLQTPLSTLTVVDLDANGIEEWLVTGATGVTLFKPDGTRCWHLATEAPVRAVDIGDVNGDGKLDIAAGCDDHNVYLLDGDGQTQWTFPCKPSQGSTDGAPTVDYVTITDLENDGKMEIVAGANWVHVLNADGSLRWERYMDLRRGRICGDFACGTVADLNGDGLKEIVALFVTSYPLLQVLNAQGDMIVPQGTGKGHRGVNIGVPIDVAVLDLGIASRTRQIVCATESDVRMVWHDHKLGEALPARLAAPCVAMACTQTGPAGAPLIVVATPMCGVAAASPRAKPSERKIKMARLWRQNLGEKVTCLQVLGAPVPGGPPVVALGTKQGNVILLDSATGTLRGHARFYGAPVATIADSGNPGQLIVGMADGTVAIIRIIGKVAQR